MDFRSGLPARRPASLATLAAACLALCGPALAQEPPRAELGPTQIDVSALGPQVGEIVPDFSLPDQYGEIRTRESIMGRRGAMLVFVRSADW